MRFAVVGLDHRHIFDLVAGLLEAKATCAGYWPQTSDPRVLAGFRERFPQLTAVENVDALFDDPAIDFICCASVPADRAAVAVRAMRSGKDLMVDKPGVTTRQQLDEVMRVCKETGRIFSVCFTERFLVPAVEAAFKLIAAGEIGRVVQTIGMGPHRMNRAIRPDWFFDPARFGGILADIGSHQIDQFLYFTGSQDAEIVTSTVGNFGTPDVPAFQDFGEILIRSPHARGYVRLDWFTPDGLPTWGDGRMTILGTGGYIELRKYVDIEGRPGTNHLFMANAKGTRYVDCSKEPLTYFGRFIADVRDRTETAMTQQHVFTVCRLSVEAQERAEIVRVAASV